MLGFGGGKWGGGGGEQKWPNHLGPSGNTAYMSHRMAKSTK